MAANRVVAFLDNLRASQVLEARQIDEVIRAVKLADDPAPLARMLIQRSLLTPFQVNQIIRGAGKELALGPYRLLDRIGEGGCGQVYKAYHQRMDRIVAIKVMRKEKLNHPDAVRRFLQEIRAAGQLVHPNIVMAFDAGQENGTHFFAMEYVDGIDLTRMVKESGPQPVVHACEYIRQAALGLQHAHERGMVHRDIKPSNLLLTKVNGSPPLGLIKILDMGLARLQNPDEQTQQLTRLGVVVGTPDFLAPEQAKNSSTVDTRADLYSLGCTFYYLLAAQKPFTGATSTEVMIKHLTDEPTPLSSLRNDVPPGVQAMVKKLMAKKPEDRFQIPAELSAALGPYCGQGVVTAMPVNVAARPTLPMMSAATLPTTPAPKPAAARGPIIRRRTGRRRRPMLAAAIVLVLMGATAGVGALMYPQIVAAVAQGRAESSKATEVAETRPPATNADRPTQATPQPKDDPKTTPDPAVKSDPKVDPKPKTDPKADPKPEPKPKPDPKPEMLKGAIPDATKQAPVDKAIHEKYKLEYSRKKADDVAALANQLLADAAQADDLTMRFVLLREARDLAAVSGSMETMMKAIDELDKTFAVNALEMKIAGLEKASQAQNLPPVRILIVDTALKLIEEMVEADNYDAADRILAAAKVALQKLNREMLQARVNIQAKDLADTRKEYETAKAAHDTLDKDPDDPQASTKWGKFLAFYKGHWGDGLPLLARGSDEALGVLAQKDLAGPKDPIDQAAIGDAWYALGKVQKIQVAKRNIWLHARFWYEQALPGLTGPAKEEAEKRVKEIDAILPKDEPPPVTTTTTTPTPTPKPEPPPKTEGQLLAQSGQKFYKAGRYADAIDAYKKALALEPDNKEAKAGLRKATYALHMAQGQQYMSQRKFRDAADEFRQALEQFPNDPLAEAYLAWANNNGTGNRPSRKGK
jgi:serine/threonine protein kinase/tetratricopeptide (TPR) repeat protein